jgi:hypothetical protein
MLRTDVIERCRDRRACHYRQPEPGFLAAGSLGISATWRARHTVALTAQARRVIEASTHRDSVRPEATGTGQP